MNAHTLKLLQFDRIIEELSNLALTEEGKREIGNAEFVLDRGEHGRRLSLAVAYRHCLEVARAGNSPTSFQFPEISALLPRLGKEGAALETFDLKAISVFSASASKLRRMLSAGCDVPQLLSLIEEVPELPALCAAVDRVIDDEGELREKDLPELRTIRSQIRSVQDDIRAASGSYLSRTDYSGFWNSDVATVKDGRTVLPLKSQFKGRVRGIVHEVSTTGATLFIEPEEIVEKNNQLVETQARYAQEVLRILRDLTRTVANYLPQLEQMLSTIVELDTLHMRAEFARVHLCSPAGHGNDEDAADIILNAARHPLIGKGVVPVDVIMERDSRVLIITGPNTGGKTVLLKTVGLLALINQFCVEVPAAPGSKLPLFDDILADIGDEQSIEQSLSTFSGHMRNISDVLRGSTPVSLVLLDELGSGTDPEEGSALAMAVIDRLLSVGVSAMVTTHHSILKNYGYTRQGVRNASMDFDRETLMPTYRIILGVPGSSHAIDIARRNGIPRSVADSARRYLHDEQTDAAGLIRRLTQKEQDVNRRTRELDRGREELGALRDELAVRERDLAVRELAVRRNAVSDLERFVADTRKDLERLVRELREGQLDREKTRAVKLFIDELDLKVQQQKTDVTTRRRELAPAVEQDLSVGSTVVIRETGRSGTIVRKGRGDTWIVSAGAMKVTLHAYELSAVAAPALPAVPKIEVAFAPTEGHATFELNVRGMRLDEALAVVERQVDLASMQGLGSFGIIHGKGEGVLQKGIHEYLAQSPAVSEFHFARPEEGGFGKTFVSLRL